jgi:hypothetical protein
MLVLHDLRCVSKKGHNSKTREVHDNARGHYHVNDCCISLTKINAWHMTMSTPMKKSNLELIWNKLNLLDGFGLFMVFNPKFNNISIITWRSVLLVEEKTGVPVENHRPATSHWQTLLHYVVSSMPRHERGSNSQL